MKQHHISAINEKAVAENIDLKTAAYNLAQDLRDYGQLGSLNRAIELVKQQLTVLDIFVGNKQQALTSLMNLQSAGFSEKDIMELMGIVNRWNRQHPGLYHRGNELTLLYS